MSRVARGRSIFAIPILLVVASSVLADLSGPGRPGAAANAAMPEATAAPRTGEPVAAPSVTAPARRAAGFEHDLERHLEDVRPLLERYGYLAIFVAIFVEGFGIPAPGQTLLIAAALLAAGGELSLVPLLLVALLASAGGTLVGWTIGRFGGRRLLDRFQGPRLAKLEETFRRRGGAVVAFGRFLDGARQLAGIASGALGMPLGSFVWWNAVGAVAWVAVWALGSFVLERDVYVLVDAYERIGPVATTVILGLVAALVVWLVRGRRRGRG